MGGIVLILPGENFDQTNRYKYIWNWTECTWIY